MKNILLILIAGMMISGCKKDKNQSVGEDQVHHSESIEKVETTTKKVLSPHTYAMTMVGDAHIHIDYSSPGVRGRIIFGGLVGYDNVWQAGAHKATWIETNKDLIIDGKILPAGKYGFFTIPSKGEWTVIINTNWDQHGKDEYDQKDDVLRFKVNPVSSDEIMEHLEYKVTKTSETEGTISMSWEKVTVSFSFEIKQ
jgi:hypothetical protein